MTSSEGYISKWISNFVLVKKYNGKYRVWKDFFNLNQVYLKNNFPFTRINRLLDFIVGHKLLSFMDAYLGYNQFHIYPADGKNIYFITNTSLYCYKVSFSN